MKLITVDELRQKVIVRWRSGDLLRAAVTDFGMFPLRLPCNRPTGPEVGGNFAQIHDWLRSLRDVETLHVETRTIRTRDFLFQDLPTSISIQTVEAAVAFIGETEACTTYRRLHAHTANALPEVMSWVEQFPLRVVAHADDWPRLLEVVTWLRLHPRPAVYVRAIDLPGIDSKFTETYRLLLAELFDLVLPLQAIDERYRASSNFEHRYGFLCKPIRIRFRTLDTRLQVTGLPGMADVQLDASSFAALDLPLRRVFVTENEINFLSFPAVPDSIVIFGKGYGAHDLLNAAPWIQRLPIFYWGDIDTHGFAILDDMRSIFPKTVSLLMDRQTLIAHREFWGTEPRQAQRTLAHLTADENQLYSELRDDSLGRKIRLEQERIAFSIVASKVSECLSV